VRRALAIIAAILMIGGAFLYRSRADSKDAEKAEEASRPTGTLVCTPELSAACDQLRKANPSLTTRVEEAGVTYATLVDPKANRDSAKLDAWLAPQPWPAMVAEQRTASSLDPLLAEPSKVLARSPIVMVVWKDRLAALERTCPAGTADWKCVGTVAGKPWTEAGGDASWGAVKPGHGPPDRSAAGLFTFAQATGQYLGRTDYARNDLDDPDYRVWANQLEQAVPTFTPSTGSAVGQMLSFGRSSFDVAGSIEANAGPAIAGSREKDALSILYPAPVATADVVLVPLRGSDAGGRVKQLLESTAGLQALSQTGWRVDGQPTIPGVNTTIVLDPQTNLPRAGVMAALRDVWKEVK
jgi:hypothetical protein